jgi:hypothetical protein
MSPPPARVFVVLVIELEPPDEHGIAGTIEHWNWVEEDSELRQAPINWNERYNQLIWSR